MGDRGMRALLAAGLALFLALTAAAPHVHAHGTDECVVCVVRHGDAARDETPRLAPLTIVGDAPQVELGLPPVFGAPLGAIPGQSPPAGA
jgi:hypothetical protein